jgi:hypothetical protein
MLRAGVRRASRFDADSVFSPANHLTRSEVSHGTAGSSAGSISTTQAANAQAALRKLVTCAMEAAQVRGVDDP